MLLAPFVRRLVVGLSTMKNTTNLSTVLYSVNNLTGTNNGVWLFNFTLAFSTGNDCYMKMYQPLRGMNAGFESEHFTVADSISPSLFWQQNGSTPLNPNEGQPANSSAPNPLSPALSLYTDSDAAQFPDKCLSLDNHFEGDCWSALQLSKWIPQWVQANILCAIDATCQTASSTVPPWTQTFLASAGWGPNRECWYIGSESCANTVYVAPRKAENRQDRLLFARYAYTSYTIYCRFKC